MDDVSSLPNAWYPKRRSNAASLWGEEATHRTKWPGRIANAASTGPNSVILAPPCAAAE